MIQVFGVDWQSVLMPGTPLLEIFLRGTAVYLVLLTFLRLGIKRQSGAVSIEDMLVIVLLADASQNAMAGSYSSITDGILLVATILFWSYALDWLGYRVPRLQRFIHPAPLKLVKDGQPIWENLRGELITQEELMGQIRQQGIDDISQVKEAYLEGDGKFSFISYEGQPRAKGEPERGSSGTGM